MKCSPVAAISPTEIEGELTTGKMAKEQSRRRGTHCELAKSGAPAYMLHVTIYKLGGLP